MKKLISIILAILMLVTMIPFTPIAFAAEEMTVLTEFCVYEDDYSYPGGWSNDSEENYHLGIQDEGKTAWAEGDELLIIFDEYDTDTWERINTQTALLRYENEQFNGNISFVYDENSYIETYGCIGKGGGTDEYINIYCEIIDNVLYIVFPDSRVHYSRLRIVGEANTSYDVTVDGFFTADNFEKPITQNYTLTTDSNGNAYLYGIFNEGAILSVNGVACTLDYRNGTEAGKSYAVCAVHNFSDGCCTECYAKCAHANCVNTVCNDCGYICLHSDTLVQKDAKAPTCTQVGNEAYEYCTECDYTTYVEIPVAPDAHNFEDGKCECGEAIYTYDEATDTYTVYTFAGLETALTAGGNIILGADITRENTKDITAVPENITAVLDLNGKTITSAPAVPGVNYEIICVNGNLTIKDSDTNGTITANSYMSCIYVEGGNLTIEAGNFICDPDLSYAVDVYSGNAVINGGTFDSFNVFEEGKAVINGGEFQGCIWTWGSLIINGGTFYRENHVYRGTFDIYGGTFYRENYVFGGTFDIYGGTFHKDPSEYVANGYEAVANENGTWTVVCAHTDKLVQVGAKAPTCTEIGWEAYEYCTACDYTTYVELPVDPDAHNFEDGKCACGYECAHEWGEGVLTRPTRTEEGCYTYTCSICKDTKIELVERASNYAEFKELLEKVKGYLNENLTDSMMQEVNNVINFFDLDENHRFIKGEENTVSQKIRQISEFVEVVEEGIADGTAVKVNGFEEIEIYAEPIEQELKEKYGEAKYQAVLKSMTDEAKDEIKKIKEEAEALEGSVKDNEEKLNELKVRVEAIYAKIENCLAGEHNGLDYEVTEEAKCGVNAIESATCTLCGDVLTREVENSALTHADEDGDYICDNGCGYEFEKPEEPTPDEPTPDEPTEDTICEDCGKVHDGFFAELICFFTRIINFIKNLFA